MTSLPLPLLIVCEKSAEKFVITMYSKTCSATSVNKARKDLFFQRSQNVEHIPPCANSLYHHTLRALYQAGIWSTCLERMVALPTPTSFSWLQKESLDGTATVQKWVPLWMTQREAMQECRELFLTCICKEEYTCCKCVKANLKCTAMCKCTCETRTPNDQEN